VVLHAFFARTRCIGSIYCFLKSNSFELPDIKDIKLVGTGHVYTWLVQQLIESMKTNDREGIEHMYNVYWEEYKGKPGGTGYATLDFYVYNNDNLVGSYRLGSSTLHGQEPFEFKTPEVIDFADGHKLLTFKRPLVFEKNIRL